MKISFLYIVSFLLSFPVFAQSEFASAAPDFTETPYSKENIQIMVYKDMQLACHGDRCEITSTNQHGDAWTITFTAGVGSAGSGSSNGGVVIVGNNPTATVDSSPFVGITLQYKKYNCEEVVNIPRGLYKIIMTYMHSLLNEDSSTKRNFSPAEQTMILFYTTIFNKPKGCSAQ